MPISANKFGGGGLKKGGELKKGGLRGYYGRSGSECTDGYGTPPGT